MCLIRTQRATANAKSGCRFRYLKVEKRPKYMHIYQETFSAEYDFLMTTSLCQPVHTICQHFILNKFSNKYITLQSTGLIIICHVKISQAYSIEIKKRHLHQNLQCIMQIFSNLSMERKKIEQINREILLINVIFL